MKDTGKEDLRVVRTKEAIRKALEEMICEMDYEGISVKELTERARIDRKTFYLHYNSIDDLLRRMQSDMAKDFVRRTRLFRRPEDMDKITREFYSVSESNGSLYEKLMCNGNYRYIRKQITDEIMGNTWKAGGDRPSCSEHNNGFCRPGYHRDIQAMGVRRQKDSG